jgi:hypothetical protein
MWLGFVTSSVGSVDGRLGAFSPDPISTSESTVADVRLLYFVRGMMLSTVTHPYRDSPSVKNALVGGFVSTDAARPITR